MGRKLMWQSSPELRIVKERLKVLRQAHLAKHATGHDKWTFGFDLCAPKFKRGHHGICKTPEWPHFVVRRG